MSINERRDKLRQSLFKKLCMINTKSQYSKVPLWVFSTGKMLCWEAIFQWNKICYSVIWKSFKGIMYKIKISELKKKFKNHKGIEESLNFIAKESEVYIQQKIENSTCSLPSRNNPLFMKTIKVKYWEFNFYRVILKQRRLLETF